MKKRKENYTSDKHKFSIRDSSQSPPYAFNIIQPFIPEDAVIWEPAIGKGYLSGRMRDMGYSVIETDISTGQNFFEYEPDDDWDVLITNPPFSTKFYWLERCYSLGKPFALLLPTDTISAKSANKYFREYGIKLLIPTSRIDFEMPFKGFTKNGAHFPTIWFTWGIDLQIDGLFSDIKFVDIVKEEFNV